MNAIGEDLRQARMQYAELAARVASTLRYLRVSALSYGECKALIALLEPLDAKLPDCRPRSDGMPNGIEVAAEPTPISTDGVVATADPEEERRLKKILDDKRRELGLPT
jgi:3-deoxy-D-manno-octulosonic-acid transferase